MKKVIKILNCISVVVKVVISITALVLLIKDARNKASGDVV